MTVDEERAARGADALGRGDESVPAEARVVAREIEMLARAGVPVDAVERLLDAAPRCGATERAALIEHARRSMRVPTSAEATEAALPDLDADDLLADCPVALAAARAVARRALACPDLTVLAFLAAASCALAARVVGVTRNNDGSVWEIYPHLYIGAEAPSGANKSLIANAMLRHALREPWRTITAGQAKAARADTELRHRLKGEQALLRESDPTSPRLEVLAELLDKPRILRPVVLEVGGNTPVNWVRQLQWSGFGAIVPDEAADWLQQFVGGPGESMRAGPLLTAWGGEEFAYRSIAGEQRGDANPRFPDLHASALLLLQPGVLSPTTREEQKRLRDLYTRGVFPRMMTARPRALTIAERRALEDDVLQQQDGGEAQIAYTNVLQALALAEVPGHPLQPQTDDNRPAPLHVEFTPEATRARRAYQVACGDEVAADGPSRGQVGERFVARLHDHAARVAICLAAWRQAEADYAATRPVDLRAARVELRDVERAVRLCERYLRPHGDAAASRTVLDEVGDDAETLREALTRESARAMSATVRQRDAQRALGRGWDAKRVGRAASELEARGGLLIERTTRGGATFTLAP